MICYLGMEVFLYLDLRLYQQFFCKRKIAKNHYNHNIKEIKSHASECLENWYLNLLINGYICTK